MPVDPIYVVILDDRGQEVRVRLDPRDVARLRRIYSLARDLDLDVHDVFIGARAQNDTDDE
jgi:hypothetical protein